MDRDFTNAQARHGYGDRIYVSKTGNTCKQIDSGFSQPIPHGMATQNDKGEQQTELQSLSELDRGCAVSKN